MRQYSHGQRQVETRIYSQYRNQEGSVHRGQIEMREYSEYYRQVEKRIYGRHCKQEGIRVITASRNAAIQSRLHTSRDTYI
jgi:hypothetical protein